MILKYEKILNKKICNDMGQVLAERSTGFFGNAIGSHAEPGEVQTGNQQILPQARKHEIIFHIREAGLFDGVFRYLGDDRERQIMAIRYLGVPLRLYTRAEHIVAENYQERKAKEYINRRRENGKLIPVELDLTDNPPTLH